MHARLTNTRHYSRSLLQHAAAMRRGLGGSCSSRSINRVVGLYNTSLIVSAALASTVGPKERRVFELAFMSSFSREYR